MMHCRQRGGWWESRSLHLSLSGAKSNDSMETAPIHIANGGVCQAIYSARYMITLTASIYSTADSESVMSAIAKCCTKLTHMFKQLARTGHYVA
jgi:hypothetical protein